jgi:glutamate dehydrogenase
MLSASVDEILLSHDKTIAVIDGSGVLADPLGINREELVRLAKARKPVAHFDKSKLGKGGYLVKVEEQDVKLPCKFGYPLAIYSPCLKLPF